MPARERRTWETASASPGTARTVCRKYRDQRMGAKIPEELSPALPGRRLFPTGSDLLDEAQIGAQLLHHAILDSRAARRGLRLRKGGLGLFGPTGRQVRHAQVMKRRRSRRALARAAQALDGPVVFLALVVYPA